MAKSNSFDIVSKTDMEEVSNATNQTMKEVHQRFDFKKSCSDIKIEAEKLILISDDEYKLQALTAVLEEKLIRRKVSLKAFEYGKAEAAGGNTVRQEVSIQQGIPMEKAKEIVKIIKKAKIKVQAAIQGDTVRVSGKDRDTLQEVIQLIKAEDMGIDMQFTNYRSN
jgi:cyclic-di-GMP-binding protein